MAEEGRRLFNCPLSELEATLPIVQGGRVIVCHDGIRIKDFQLEAGSRQSHLKDVIRWTRQKLSQVEAEERLSLVAPIGSDG